MRHSVPSIALTLLLVTAAIACGGDDDPTGPAEIHGVYELIAFNGEPLPYVDVFEQDTTIVESGALHLGVDLGAAFVVEYRFNSPTPDTITFRGPYQYVGNEISIDLYDEYSGSLTFALSGTIAGSTITVVADAEDLEFTFRK